ncbi:hypothetical protein VXS02_05340 [Photobacterium piscicola]|uniref:hypothetical protein n=1 Tax=Photobacterium piscicola TaxID=1378299 RepID=UPI002E1895A5|nr:hypothetical protein [Photobacterium piscicola]MEC6881398.1 hypothetical protein [Photobacterium piscicola]
MACYVTFNYSKYYLDYRWEKGIGKGICQYLANKNNIVIATDAGHQLVADNPKIRFWPADVTNKNGLTTIINEITLHFSQ